MWWPMIARDDDGSNWTPGYGMAVTGYDSHYAYDYDLSRCNCGMTYTLNEWRKHRNREWAATVLIEHGKDDKGECYTCGKVRGSYAGHLLDMLTKAGFILVH